MLVFKLRIKYAQLYVNNANVSNTNLIPIDGSNVTQPISAVSLPLPTGAATSALQLTHATYLANGATSVLQNAAISVLTGIYNELSNLGISGRTLSNSTLTANAITIGGLAKTTNPVPVRDGTVVNQLYDTSGKSYCRFGIEKSKK